METLFIQLDDQNSAQWLVLDDEGRPAASLHRGPLESLKDFARQRRIVCALNSGNVLLEQVRLPASRNRRRLQQAVPFALEDELAEDIDALHFALGKERTPAPDGEDEDEAALKQQVDVPVAVIEKNTLERWLDVLSEAGFKPHVLVPDVLALPLNDDEWTVLLHEDTAWVRTGPHTGFTCEADNLEILLNAELQTRTPPQRVRIWNHGSAVPEPVLDREDVEVEVTRTDQTPLDTLARGYKRDHAINLLQGEYSYRQEFGKMLKPWRVPGVLLGVLLVLLFGATGVEYFQLKAENERLNAEILEVYKQVFPRSRNTTDPRRQFENALADLGGGGGEQSPLLELMNVAATELNALGSARILSINFTGERLDIETSVNDVQQLDGLKQALEGKGLETEIQSASAEGDRVTGQLRISAR